MSSPASPLDAPDVAATPPALSVVIPAYNAESTLPRTVDSVLADFERAGWADIEIVLVDDGSTDGTAEALDPFADRCAVTVVRQTNQGRFRARLAGLRAASGELVLLIDSRVTVRPGSIEFLRSQVAAGRTVWNAHAHTVPSPSLAAHYWDAITAVAWRRYYRDPRHVELDLDNYDFYPKGTTMFVAPRRSLIAACEAFDTDVDDLDAANDDTLLLRPLLEEGVINLAPGFACDYEARSSLRSFVRHSFHRGAVLIDGHDRPGSRLRIPIRLSLVSAPALGLAAVRRPRLGLAAAIVGCATLGAVARWAGAERRASVALAVLTPVFAPAYYAGMVRGVLLRRRASGAGSP